MTPKPPRTPSPSGPPSTTDAQAIGEAELDELQALLDKVPPSLEPLDTVMLDGFLCGILLQPRPVPPAEWLPYVTDIEGNALPRGFDTSRLYALIEQRFHELDRAITQRQWFDPWVFEYDEDTSPSETVFPWVAGFSMALELFPSLMDMPAHDLQEPLATLYAHLDPDDLEDAEELLAEIETLEPPADLEEAVEGLVRSTLLLADLSRPVPARPSPRGGKTPNRGPRRS